MPSADFNTYHIPVDCRIQRDLRHQRVGVNDATSIGELEVTDSGNVGPLADRRVVPNHANRSTSVSSGDSRASRHSTRNRLIQIQGLSLFASGGCWLRRRRARVRAIHRGSGFSSLGRTARRRRGAVPARCPVRSGCSSRRRRQPVAGRGVACPHWPWRSVLHEDVLPPPGCGDAFGRSVMTSDERRLMAREVS